MLGSMRCCSTPRWRISKRAGGHRAPRAQPQPLQDPSKPDVRVIDDPSRLGAVSGNRFTVGKERQDQGVTGGRRNPRRSSCAAAIDSCARRSLANRILAIRRSRLELERLQVGPLRLGIAASRKQRLSFVDPRSAARGSTSVARRASRSESSIRPSPTSINWYSVCAMPGSGS